VDVGFELADVADVQLLPGGGHHLHDADGAHRALDRLVQTRLLEPLGGHEQVVDVVLRAVLPEEVDDLLEALHLGWRRRILGELRAREIPLEQHVAVQRPGPVGLDEPVEGLLELGTVRTNRDGDLAARGEGGRLVDLQPREHLHPELRDEVVHHGVGGHAGVHHLEDVVVFERSADVISSRDIGTKPT
jgi:hypothetical protein